MTKVLSITAAIAIFTPLALAMLQTAALIVA